MHNAKSAMRVFPEHGWSIAGVTMDTALAAYLVKPGRRSFALDALSVEYLHRELAPRPPPTASSPSAPTTPPRPKPS